MIYVVVLWVQYVKSDSSSLRSRGLLERLVLGFPVPVCPFLGTHPKEGRGV